MESEHGYVPSQEELDNAEGHMKGWQKSHSETRESDIGQMETEHQRTLERLRGNLDAVLVTLKNRDTVHQAHGRDPEQMSRHDEEIQAVLDKFATDLEGMMGEDTKMRLSRSAWH